MPQICILKDNCENKYILQFEIYDILKVFTVQIVVTVYDWVSVG